MLKSFFLKEKVKIFFRIFLFWFFLEKGNFNFKQKKFNFFFKKKSQLMKQLVYEPYSDPQK